VYILYLGESGNILIHSTANRLNSYNVLDYAEGQDKYDSAMLLDLTQPRDQVNQSLAAVHIGLLSNELYYIHKPTFLAFLGGFRPTAHVQKSSKNSSEE